MEGRWLTVDDICKYLSVTKDTVYKWIDTRNMPANKVGRKWMFQKSEVDRWVKSGKAAD
ncbi:helix-turn-helix domain-containing protein [Arcobacter peruensis]|uniref:helix-turn-helix domain-containing protein n=1 Tax=Arcobacter peruensis TaxID=2320140 RepID=UPI000F0987F9|nr:helix-turn-helix domain-containing protein [Arcobacter peruensis]